MAIGLPTEEFPAGASWIENLDLSSSKKVNESIAALDSFLQLNNWDRTEPQYATLKLTIDLPIVGQAGPFSLIVLYWFGFAYQIYNPSKGDVNPVGGIILGVGPEGESAGIVGVPVNELMGQNEIIQTMVTMMNGVSDFVGELTDFIVDPGGLFDGVAQSVLFTSKVEGPEHNDKSGLGNINGGSLFNGVSKFGGYRLTSQLSPTSYIDLTLLNDGVGQLLIKTQFGAGPYVFMRKAVLTDIVMHRFAKYTLMCGPFQMVLTPTFYPSGYVPDNINDVLNGQWDFWVCCPKTPTEQIFKTGGFVVRDRGITAAVFRVMTARNLLNSATCATGVADLFRNGFFGSAGSDVGMTLITLNTFFNSAGALLTPSEMPILYSAICSLSDGQTFAARENNDPYTTQEALVCGYIWDCHFTSRAEVIGTKAYFGNKLYVAYRVQSSPCEATLWMWTGKIK